MKILLSLIFSFIFSLAVWGQQPDDATIYFYRGSNNYQVDYRLIRNIRIYINEELAFKLPAKYFVAVKLPAGIYRFKIDLEQSEMHFLVKPGKIYFIKAIQTSSNGYFNQYLMDRDEDQARIELKNLKIVPSNKMKKNKFVFIKDKYQDK